MQGIGFIKNAFCQVDSVDFSSNTLADWIHDYPNRTIIHMFYHNDDNVYIIYTDQVVQN